MLSMPTASAQIASSASSQRGSGRLIASTLQQHDDRAASAVDRARLDEREHLVAAREHAPHAPLEDGLAPRRAQALAMHDAHAAQPPAPAIGEERRSLGGRLVAGEAVQVELL